MDGYMLDEFSVWLTARAQLEGRITKVDDTSLTEFYDWFYTRCLRGKTYLEGRITKFDDTPLTELYDRLDTSRLQRVQDSPEEEENDAREVASGIDTVMRVEDRTTLDDPKYARDVQEQQEKKGNKGKDLQLGDDSSEEPKVCESDEVCDLFFAESQQVGGFAGIGCIIKDAGGQVVFRHGTCVGLEISHYLAEYKALMYGIQIAKSLGLIRITAHGNRAFIYREIKNLKRKMSARENPRAVQKEIGQGLESFDIKCVSREENEDSIKLAERAAERFNFVTINSEDVEEARSSEHRCLICLEGIFPNDMVRQTICEHFFCFNCLSQHVEHEISVGKVPVRCPQITECGCHMDSEKCETLLSPKLFDTYLLRLTEDAIADSDKVYCPFPGCSVMMVRPDQQQHSSDMYTASSSSSIPRASSDCSVECIQCHRLFCVECLVPWHADLTCREFQALPPNARKAEEDRKLLQLAKDNKWRSCRKCRNLIMLSEGSFHMTCRCGHQFCYSCGVDYLEKKKMCSCPVFYENFVTGILQQDAIPHMIRQPLPELQMRPPRR